MQFASTGSFADQNLIQQSSHFVHQFKVKIFCGLHTPAGFYNMYHYVLLLLIFANCFALNLSLDFGLDQHQRVQLVQAMTFLDLILLTILVVEWMLRLFVANCIPNYVGLHGIMKYLRKYNMSRLYDAFCIAILLTFMIVAGKYDYPQPSIRILHFLLMFHFATVVGENIKLIVMSLSLYTIVLIVATYTVYFLELYSNGGFNSLFDTAWFSFVSLATIGYGDVMIQLPITKIITSALVLCGFCVFTLPGSIIGSSLAMRLQDKRQKILCLHPAANLLQKTWRFYAIHRIEHFWPKFVLSRAQVQSQLSIKQLTRKDEYVVLFICKLSFLLAQNRFRYARLVHNTGSVPLQYAQLQRKIELVNNAVRKHKWDINQAYLQLKKIAVDLNKCQVKANKIVFNKTLPSCEPKTEKNLNDDNEQQSET